MTASLLSLDGKKMRVASVGSSDGIDSDTIFVFRQSGQMVWASYEGGNIMQGFLVGSVKDTGLEFDYIQITRSGRRDKGSSHCTVGRSAESGLLLLTERFEWSSRKGRGINHLEEMRP